MSTYRIKLEPLGEEFECDEEETVLTAAFRQGYNLLHGCREGRCSACKSFLLDGYVFLKQYSSFALSETEEEEGYTLLCRAMPESDLVIELLHYDPEHYRLENPIVSGGARVAAVEALTHDIRRLVLDIDEPADFGFRPGQFVDLWVPDVDQRRSYSMANLPGEGRLEFVIKRYPGGLFSGLLDGGLEPGDSVRFTGPYGSCCLRDRTRRALLVAGGSGMAPVLSLLRQMAEDGEGRTVRFFYGARRRHDLFYLDLIESLGRQIDDFKFVPVLSDEQPNGSWTGEYGMVHEAVDRGVTTLVDFDVYMAGPPPLVDAAAEVLSVRHGVDPGRVFFDRFTFTGPPLSDAGERAVQTGAMGALGVSP